MPRDTRGAIAGPLRNSRSNPAKELALGVVSRRLGR
jgi:hypothetical protein